MCFFLRLFWLSHFSFVLQFFTPFFHINFHRSIDGKNIPHIIPNSKKEIEFKFGEFLNIFFHFSQCVEIVIIWFNKIQIQAESVDIFFGDNKLQFDENQGNEEGELNQTHHENDEVRCVRENPECWINSGDDGEDSLIKVPSNINDFGINSKFESVFFSRDSRIVEVTLARLMVSRIYYALPHLLPIINIITLLVSV